MRPEDLFGLEMEWHGDKVAAEVEQGIHQVLFDVSEHLLEHANRTVPHDEGTLERSGFTSVDLGAREAAINYDTPYARRLHESEPGEYSFRGKGRRKWLEEALKERHRDVRKHAASELRKVFR